MRGKVMFSVCLSVHRGWLPSVEVLSDSSCPSPSGEAGYPWTWRGGTPPLDRTKGYPPTGTPPPSPTDRTSGYTLPRPHMIMLVFLNITNSPNIGYLIAFFKLQNVNKNWITLDSTSSFGSKRYKNWAFSIMYMTYMSPPLIEFW